MNKNNTLEFWESSVHNVDPIFMLKTLPKGVFQADAFLFWGKASVRFFEALQQSLPEKTLRRKAILGIYPKTSKARSPRIGTWIAAEHPLPGMGSFRAGKELMHFFETLKNQKVRKLVVFLSGGASSLAWLPRKGPKGVMTQAEILKRLHALYRAGLDIGELNAKRSKLCELKAGGAARWLSSIAPQVHAQVFVISDVAPLGPEVVGSGPFWNGHVPHHVLADNDTLVQVIVREARKRKISVLQASSGKLGSWQSWMQTAIPKLRVALRDKKSGLLIFGGEPSVKLPVRKRHMKGGRQTHLALALAHRLRPWILQGRVEILAMSSDGSDGNSGAAGAWLDSIRFPNRFASVDPDVVRKALEEYRSAPLLKKLGALVIASSRLPRSNVQDVLIIQIQ
jgi:glycerate-2-kinase